MRETGIVDVKQTQSSSHITTSVSEFRSEESQNEQKNRTLLKYDENIARIISLGMEEKLIKSQYSKVNIQDALVKVSHNVSQFSIKQSASFLYAVSKLLSYGYAHLSQELREFFARFKDEIMRGQQQQQREKQQRSSRKQQTKKRLRDAARELADNLSGAGSSIDERSNTSIQQPRNISTEERLNLQEKNIISPLMMMMQRDSLDMERLAASSDENSNTGMSDQMRLADPQKQRLQILGQEEEGFNGAGGLPLDYDGFQYDFSDRDSDNQGFDRVNVLDMSQELHRMSDISERLIRKVVNYENQQSSKKKTKNIKGKTLVDRESAIINDSVDQNQNILEKAMNDKLDEFFQGKSGFKGSSVQDDIPSILNSTTIGMNEESLIEIPLLNSSVTQYLNGSCDHAVSNLSKKFEDTLKLRDTHTLLNDDFIHKLEMTMQNVTFDLPKQHEMNEYDELLNQEDQNFLAHENNNEDSNVSGQNENKWQDESREADYTKKDSNIQELQVLNDQSEQNIHLRTALTEEEKKKVVHYEKLFNRLSDIIRKENCATFSEIHKQFKNQKSKAELFYDFLELQKLGQLELKQSDPLTFSPIEILIN